MRSRTASCCQGRPVSPPPSRRPATSPTLRSARCGSRAWTRMPSRPTSSLRRTRSRPRSGARAGGAAHSRHHLGALVDGAVLRGDDLPVEPEDARGLLVPAVRSARAPERAAAYVVDRPAQRLEVRIAGVVIAGVQLDSVAVRVAKVDEEGVGDAMTAGPALDGASFARGGQLVAYAQDPGRLADPERRVVQPRAATRRQCDVVDAGLAQQ